jgi:hypothetical protein
MQGHGFNLENLKNADLERIVAFKCTSKKVACGSGRMQSFYHTYA